MSVCDIFAWRGESKRVGLLTRRRNYKLAGEGGGIEVGEVAPRVRFQKETSKNSVQRGEPYGGSGLNYGHGVL